MTHPTPHAYLGRDTVAAALGRANLPTLIPVLFQLTGDERWLAEPYRVTATPGFALHDDGGLPPEVQAEVREAAIDAIVAWHAGQAPAVAEPEGDLLVRLMASAIGEPVPDSLEPLIAEQLGFRPFAAEDVSALAAERPDFNVVVIGAGFSGLAAAVKLKQAGVPFVVIERNPAAGGTWFENRYPGARVDVPSDLYSYSFFPRNWTETFSQRDEIHGYVQAVVDHYGLDEHLRTGTAVESVHWDESTGRWTVTTREADGTGAVIDAAVVVTAAGLHSTPRIPGFEGLEAFTGEVVHSARWPAGTDLRGKRVAVVGTGASAMQLAVAVADEVSEMTILQRAPHWVAPNEHYFSASDDTTHWLFDHVPFYRGWHRFRLYWLYTERTAAALPVDPDAASKGKVVSSLNDAFRRFFTQYLVSQLDGDQGLIDKTLPAYPPFGKRLLLDNGWFTMLKKPHVDLLCAGVERLDGNRLVATDGTSREIDVLILCTGFEQQRFLFPLEVKGRNGTDLRAAWEDDDGRAYLGITAPGFPNLFFLYGPNTNPPGGSYLTIAEAQIKYVVSMISTMLSEDLATVECRSEPFEQYNKELDLENDRMVYAQDGVENYYRNARGRVVTNSPWPVARYAELTRSPDLHDFDVSKRG
ncbi:NAD(P)-binding domain-containing protein [Rhodococcus koreensis]|uniref:NAD(P)/FAD-dependent oxidoreductase n=1 Tax=Rhodococcus koreensis TaxID=99653 RepID=UPI003671D0BC